MREAEYLAHSVRVAAFICRDYHGGQWSACYAIQCGSWEHLTADDLRRAADELAPFEGEGDEVWEAIRDLREGADHWGDVQAALIGGV